MTGHIVIGQIAIFDFEQYIAGGADQDTAERMIAVYMRAPGDVETPAQKSFVIKRRQEPLPLMSVSGAILFSDRVECTNGSPDLPAARRQRALCRPQIRC